MTLIKIISLPLEFIFNLFLKMLVSVLNDYLPHLSFLISLSAILLLVLLDPLTSYYAFIKTGSLENAKALNFASEKSYSTALDVLWTTAFIYLVKTDGKFIDKFIDLLKVLQGTLSKTKNSITQKISNLGKK